MTPQEGVSGILRARAAAERTLVDALTMSGSGYSEKQLADNWLHFIKRDQSILPYGWYQPPPNGMSVLLGTPPNYERLQYQSLRETQNFPSPEIRVTDETVIYPYFSAVDRKTGMIGDHVATYYSGRSPRIRDWMKQVYHMTRGIAEATTAGMRFCDVYGLAEDALNAVGATNNTYSLSGGLAADIGHTVPHFGADGWEPSAEIGDTEPSQLAERIAKGREFVSAENSRVIAPPCAFTIEPQALMAGLPMVSFHLIVAITDDGKYIIENFDKVFAFFGMNDWLGRSE